MRNLAYRSRVRAPCARQESKGAGQEFLVFKMSNVLVTSVSMAETSKDEARPTETVTLNFAKLDIIARSSRTAA
jgi:type VI protein secretion system component Hcp